MQVKLATTEHLLITLSKLSTTGLQLTRVSSPFSSGKLHAPGNVFTPVSSHGHYRNAIVLLILFLRNSDIIDGMNVKNGLNPDEALSRTLQAFDASLPVFHVVGKYH